MIILSMMIITTVMSITISISNIYCSGTIISIIDICVCMYVCMYVCIYIYIYIHIRLIMILLVLLLLTMVCKVRGKGIGLHSQVALLLL